MIESTGARSLSHGVHCLDRGLAHSRRRWIQRRAYEKWKTRGCPTGSRVQDWLEAEQEVNAGPLHHLIELRAYERWKNRGSPTGSALRDWLEAEQEINHELTSDN